MYSLTYLQHDKHIFCSVQVYEAVIISLQYTHHGITQTIQNDAKTSQDTPTYCAGHLIRKYIHLHVKITQVPVRQ